MPSTKVGAIIIAQESYQILSLGYNGFPRSINDEKKERWITPTKNKFVEHAERNAIYNASRHGTPLNNGIAIVTLFPCHECARALIQSGIKIIITHKSEKHRERWSESWNASEEMFNEAGTTIIELTNQDIHEKIDATIKLDNI